MKWKGNYLNKPSSNIEMGEKDFPNLYFLRAYVQNITNHKYLATPPNNDYLIQRQRGQLEGMTENLYRLNQPKSTSNTSYARAGNYDIASKLGLYNPTTSVTVDLYQPKRNIYQKGQDQYLRDY